MSTHRSACAALAAIALFACEPPREEGTLPELPEPPPPTELEDVYAPGRTPRDGEERASILPAFYRDSAYDSDDPEVVRQVVYRLNLAIPRSLGTGSATVPRTAAELYLEVSNERLRARFVGGGWPVPEGSEVRVRGDQPGAYVFDAGGGRPLAPDQLAIWFEGGRKRFDPTVRIWVPDAELQRAPGVLICRFLAEWAGIPPDSVMRRCGDGGSPPNFRVGLWRGERTADVLVRRPRRVLRADQESPPAAIPPSRHHGHFLTEEMLGRIPHRRAPRHNTPADDAPESGLVVANTGNARMIVTVGGTPVGWVDAGHEIAFPGLEPGSYNVGATRPFGLLAARGRVVVVPSRVQLPR